MKVSWKKVIVIILMSAMLVPALFGCANNGTGAALESSNIEAQSEPKTESEAEPIAEPEAEPEPEEVLKGSREAVVYFANWYLNSKKGMEGGEASFERREKNEAPRTQFSIVSTQPEMISQNIRFIHKNIRM